jgi:hypothetical protein
MIRYENYEIHRAFVAMTSIQTVLLICGGKDEKKCKAILCGSTLHVPVVYLVHLTVAFSKMQIRTSCILSQAPSDKNPFYAKSPWQELSISVLRISYEYYCMSTNTYNFHIQNTWFSALLYSYGTGTVSIAYEFTSYLVVCLHTNAIQYNLV